MPSHPAVPPAPPVPPRRADLPPPPPPAGFAVWPDRAARLADRAAALDELARRLLGPGRMALFLAWLLLLETGWGLIGLGFAGVGGGGVADPFEMLVGIFAGAVGIAVLVPAVWLTLRGLGRDRTARERLLQWAALDRDPVADARLRAPGASVRWLLLSFALCAVGLWASFAAPARATPGNGGYPLVVYGIGAGLILWVTGLTGLAKAVGHYRLAVRLTARPAAPAPAAEAGPVTVPPAARSASSEPPRPE
ncbi:hypothetical protein [Streptomyces sp. NPDC090025]|uniref:hypothetical protein n=1 Tax=Streptomyces sp. NPDC090025 TaxID=3365922 RepID=UPI0038373D63